MTESQADEVIDAIEEVFKDAGVEVFFIAFYRPTEPGENPDEATGHYTGRGGSTNILELLEICKEIVNKRVKRQ